MGSVRGLCLSLVAAGLTAGLGALGTPSSQAALPGPDSTSWTPVKKSTVVLTDQAGDLATPHLDLTAAGGALATATVFVAADLSHASFRFHVAAAPAAGAPGGYVVQFDTNDSTAGWERALRYDPDASTITFFTGGPNAGVKDAGTPSTVLPTTAATATTYPGADGGAYVAFAVPRTALSSAGISLGAPMVIGTSTVTGAGLDAPLLGAPKADVLGIKKFGLGTPGWGTLATDVLPVDSDGDGVPDNADNCPVDVNPLQEDDDQPTTPPTPGTDNSLPPEPAQNIPDGTEGLGNACDPTPRGYDSDEDGVGYLDDECVERPGVKENGCPDHSSTVSTLRYNGKKKLFTGATRGSTYDECTPVRTLSLRRVARGADPELRVVKSNAAGKFRIKLAKKPKKGKYYVHVDPKNMISVGVICFADNSPKITIR